MLDGVHPFSVGLTPDENGNVTVALCGEIDIDTADEVWAALIEALTAWTGQVVVDLAGVSFVDSQGIAAFIRVYRDCSLDAVRLTIRSPQAQVRTVFELTSLDQIFRIEH